jgi:CBS domain-containing protein
LGRSESIKENTVENIMNKRLVTLEADSTALQAAKLMSEKNIGSVIITDNDKIIGIVTERDLIKIVCAADLQASKAPIASFMSAPLITISKNATIANAAEIMVKNKMRHLGVKDSDGNGNGNEIIGVISSVDLIKLLIQRL